MASRKKITSETKAKVSEKANGKAEGYIDQAAATKLPKTIQPMLATLIDKPFDEPGWLYEVKWDGYRALSYVNNGDVQTYSRNNKSFNEKFYPVYETLKKWQSNIMIDGEIVVLNENGQSDFNSLQNWRSEADGELIYYVFDILWFEGKSLMKLPLTQRQEILKAKLPDQYDNIRVSQAFNTNGKVFYEEARKLKLEGIMAKKADSIYIPGVRSKEWLKVKIQKRQEAIIGGFTKNEGSPKLFSALLLGMYENGELRFTGKVGTGFTDKLQEELMEQFKPLIVKRCPFSREPDVNQPSRFRPNPPRANATWLKPELVGEINYSQITKDGVFRHPSFAGIREDKKAKEVIREKPEKTDEVTQKDTTGKQQKIISPPKNKKRKTLLNPKNETQVRKINGHELKFTNLSKVFWPREKITKRDMLNYYYQIAPFILPYLKDRPQSLNRFPNGIEGESFYQKNVKDKAPEWLQTFPYTTSDGEHKEFLVGTDEYSLLWMASMGAIEMNPWFSRVQSPDNPDYCVIDLDPDKNTFEQVLEAAQITKKVLDAIEVPCYCKTSGSTGMHIYIPLEAKYTYDQSQLFGRLIAQIIHEEIPTYTSVERIVKNRKGKMYIDFLQNRPGATLACPYSLRPKPGATVSMPLYWDEVKKGLKMNDFTISNAPGRVRENGDIFKPVLDKGIDLEKTLERVKDVFKK